MNTFFVLLLFLKLSTCERRITNGTTVDNDANTSFMVSIVSAKVSSIIPGWLCGGSIIHPSLVLTSASCLHTVKKMYVIAGYRKYVRTENLNVDLCSRHMKKKIIYICMHAEYGRLKANIDDKHTSEERKYKWTIFDIGVGRVDTPFNYFDHNYLKYCSYLPNSILPNFHRKFEEPGADVVVYGWGHAAYYRPVKDNNDYNSVNLRYASSKLISEKECEERFASRYIRFNIFTNYICTDGEGNMNEHGMSLVNEKPKNFRCNRRSSNSSQKTGCLDDAISDKDKLDNSTQKDDFLINTRRNGICQNDHGSPLVRWIGGHAYIIGVASGFQVNKKMECMGPSLFTSTHCTSKFVYCMLTQQKTAKTRRVPSYCDAPDTERGFKIEETYVDWSDELDELEVPKPKPKTADDSLYDSKIIDSHEDLLE